MLLDLRIMLSASFAAVLLLIGGFGLIAALRTPGKPSVEILSGPAEITGSIGARDKKSQSLTVEDRAARPAQPAAGTAPPAPAPEPVRAVNVEKTEKVQAPRGAEEDKPAKPKRAAAKAKPKPRIRAAARQNTGANFNANNPFSSPLFGSGAAPSQ
jgi:type IV secretory pathway VirB10-like protein